MQELLGRIFREYYQDVYGYLFSLSHDAALSEELTSEVFLEAVKSIAGFRGKSSVKTWLFSIARHRWFSYLRQKQRQPVMEPLEEYLTVDDPEKRIVNRATVERLQELLSQEPERSQRVVAMRLEGYSFYEIGQTLGISENSARVIDYRVKTKLRKKLMEEGYVDAGNQL